MRPYQNTWPLCYNPFAMKHSALFAAALAVSLLGAGCFQSPVALDKYPSPPETASEPAPSESGLKPPQASSASETPPAEETATTTATPTSTTPVTTSTSVTQPEQLAFPGILPASETAGKFIHLQTTKGLIVFEVLPKEGPKAASNFVYLAKRKFYDGLIFHRVVPGFVIQGGDPLGTGTGGPGYSFQDDPVKLTYKQGIVAMANAGPNTNGSQFFIMLEDNEGLPPSYSVFGRVVKGMDVVKKIAVGDKMTSVTVKSTK